jgi:hypothetical protein
MTCRAVPLTRPLAAWVIAVSSLYGPTGAGLRPLVVRSATARPGVGARPAFFGGETSFAPGLSQGPGAAEGRRFANAAGLGAAGFTGARRAVPPQSVAGGAR